MEEIIYELEIEDFVYELLENEADYQIWISGWWVHIPELELNLHEGTFYQYNHETDEFVPDFSVTVIRRADSIELTEEREKTQWLYFEQDGFLVTLANWMGATISIKRLEQMECFFNRPRNNYGRETNQ